MASLDKRSIERYLRIAITVLATRDKFSNPFVGCHPGHYLIFPQANMGELKFRCRATVFKNKKTKT
jgi:hypothetical protein